MKKISSDSISDLYPQDEREKDRFVQQGRVDVVSWLGLKRKSSGRVRQYLVKKGYSDESINAILHSLQEDGTVDDRMLAHRLARQRRERVIESLASMRQHLIQLGIDAAVVEETLPNDWQDETAAELLLQQKYGKQAEDFRHLVDEGSLQDARLQYRQLAAKAARFLRSRGFDDQLVARTVRMVFPGIDSED